MRRHWAAIQNGNYGTAYDRLAPELQEREQGPRSLHRRRRRDGLYSVDVDVAPTVTSPTTATARVLRLRTNAARSGCHDWTGSYNLRKIDGVWRISKAAVTSHRC